MLQFGKSWWKVRPRVVAKTVVLVIFLIVLSLIIFRIVSVENENKITIDKYVANYLGKNYKEITTKDYEKVEQITLYNLSNSDLKYFAKFKNLRKLKLGLIHYQEIPDNDVKFDWLPKWIRRYFIITQSTTNQRKVEQRTVNISFLGRLKNLEELKLEYMYVKNIKPLRNLKHLQTLEISLNTNNIKPLESLSSLQTLRIFWYDKEVRDISMLKNLRNLRTLSIVNSWVNNDQITELQKALPDLKIYR